jgi:hypothetical protein
MRRTIALVSTAALLALPSRGLAHSAAELAEELGHHWAMPAYRTEMLTQIALMLGACLVAIAGTLLRNAFRRRRARQ